MCMRGIRLSGYVAVAGMFGTRWDGSKLGRNVGLRIGSMFGSIGLVQSRTGTRFRKFSKGSWVMSDNDLFQMAEELEQASQLCDDECGEWWSKLAALWPSVRDGASDEFCDAYKKELREEHKRYKTEFRIVEHTETRTFVVRTLEHESEWE